MSAKVAMRNLLPLLQKRLLSTLSSSTPTLSPLSTDPSSSFTVDFLINSCGLSTNSALSVSQKLHLGEKNIQKPQSVLEFLKAHGFKEAHVVKLIEKRPGVLRRGVDTNLKPKFEFLIANGFVGELLPDLITSNPNVLERALESNIKPCFEYWKSILGSNDKFIAVSKRCAVLLTYDCKSIIQPNVELLIKEGVPEERVVKMIVAQPRIIYQRRDRMAYAINAVKNLGLEPKAPMFIYALRSMLSMNEFTWKKKIEVMKSFGWTEEEILQAFKRYPFQLSSSEEKIRRSMDFLLNTLKMEKQAIIACPKFLMYSTEKRLRPRYDVLKILNSKKLIEIGKKMNYLLVTEKRFLENYVIKFANEVPGLLEVYMGTTKTKR
ncbi:hypothetical protein OIU77_022432 [Salix suchowensis]|uniref:Uncharacterized protein n=1 Tax=Salix suchowensis TaxID=1278906 RepID=A0ABQ9C4Q1_9ROSI|nr:transcription termination factor MTERF [Salix suchowensis]KAJ6392951.1 hypothetical protein OIU77_022432 [Salix suchowensis]